MTKCSVRWCKNNSGPGSTSSFHLFPTDPSRKRKWVEAVRRDETWIPTKYSAICSVHFETTCFNTNAKKQKKLDKGAVPTLFLPIYSHEISCDAKEYSNSKFQASCSIASSLISTKLSETGNNVKDDLGGISKPRHGVAQQKIYRQKQKHGETSRQRSGNEIPSTSHIPEGGEEVGVEDEDLMEDLEEAQETEPKQFVLCSQCHEVITGFVFVCVQCVERVCGACDARGRHATHYVLRVPSGRPESEIEVVVDKVCEGLSAAGLQVLTQAEDEVKVEFNPEIKTEAEEDEDPLGGVGCEAPGPPREAAAGSQVVPELAEVKTEPPDSTGQDETASTISSLASTSTLHSDDSQPPSKRRNVRGNLTQCVTYPSHAPLRITPVRPLKSTDKQSSSTSNADPGLELYTFLDPGIPGSSGVGPRTQVLRFSKQKPSQR